MSKTRKRYSSQEKTNILREHLINNVPISDLCDQHGLHPTLFYQWQKNMFENLPMLFESKRNSEVSGLRRQTRIAKAGTVSEISDALRRMAALAASVPRQELDVLLSECDALAFAPGGAAAAVDAALRKRALDLAGIILETTKYAKT